MPVKPPKDPVRFWSKVVKTDSCWLWTGRKDRVGYGRLQWDRVQQPAHRVSLELHERPVPKGMVADHLCRNHSCVNPSHLEIVTHQENVRRGKALKVAAEEVAARSRYYYQKNRKLIGRSGWHHLTPDQVGEIRTLYAQGVKQVVIAERFNKTRLTIRLIVQGKLYKKLLTP